MSYRIQSAWLFPNELNDSVFSDYGVMDSKNHISLSNDDYTLPLVLLFYVLAAAFFLNLAALSIYIWVRDQLRSTLSKVVLFCLLSNAFNVLFGVSATIYMVSRFFWQGTEAGCKAAHFTQNLGFMSSVTSTSLLAASPLISRKLKAKRRHLALFYIPALLHSLPFLVVAQLKEFSEVSGTSAQFVTRVLRDCNAQVRTVICVKDHWAPLQLPLWLGAGLVLLVLPPLLLHRSHRALPRVEGRVIPRSRAHRKFVVICFCVLTFQFGWIPLIASRFLHIFNILLFDYGRFLSLFALTVLANALQTLLLGLLYPGMSAVYKEMLHLSVLLKRKMDQRAVLLKQRSASFDTDTASVDDNCSVATDLSALSEYQRPHLARHRMERSASAHGRREVRPILRSAGSAGSGRPKKSVMFVIPEEHWHKWAAEEPLADAAFAADAAQGPAAPAAPARPPSAAARRAARQPGAAPLVDLSEL